MPYAFIAKRLARFAVTLLVAVTLVFFATRIMPGDPAEALLGERVSAEALQALRHRMGLDKALRQQYFEFIGNLLQGDLGVSLSTGEPVSKMIFDRAPFTLAVVFGALLFGTVAGIPLGVVSALHRNRWIDYFSRVMSLGGISLPGFVISIVLIMVFSVWLGWFPMIGGGETVSFWSMIRFAVLPSLAGGLGQAAYITRLCRASMLDTLGQDYVRTARAKGLRERRVVYLHALKNALLPIVTFIGIYAIVMIGDSITIEIVFTRPGIGRLIQSAVAQRDYMLLQSVILVYVAFAAFVNLFVDLLYSMIDPRIRSEMS
jgi:ABC-type dipeptide/oligopeptide/nickel transport system permease component